MSSQTRATPTSRCTLAWFGTQGILAFATYTNGADYMLMFVPPSMTLLALVLLQVLVLVALSAVMSLGDALPILPRLIFATAAVMLAVGGTLALPALESQSAASALLCVCCSIMGLGNGVLQATSAGLAGAGGPALLTAQASGVGIANLLMSVLRVAFKLALPGRVIISYTWFAVAHMVVSILIVVLYIVAARRDPHLVAVLKQRREAAAAAAAKKADAKTADTPAAVS